MINGALSIAIETKTDGSRLWVVRGAEGWRVGVIGSGQTLEDALRDYREAEALAFEHMRKHGVEKK